MRAVALTVPLVTVIVTLPGLTPRTVPNLTQGIGPEGADRVVATEVSLLLHETDGR